MEDFQQRVIDERDELQAKRNKLLAFLPTPVFQSLDMIDRELLEDQCYVMRTYLVILDQRIARFKI